MSHMSQSVRLFIMIKDRRKEGAPGTTRSLSWDAWMHRPREGRVVELNKVIDRERARIESEIKCMNSRLLAK